MPKFIILFFLAIIFTTAASAQRSPSITGLVRDSITREPISMATVAILNSKDSSLISYTLTEQTGKFTIRNVPINIDIKLIISSFSFQTFRKVLTVPAAGNIDLGEIYLTVKNIALKDVTIRGLLPPVIIRKDTIEFNAEAFKTPPNALVETLLKRLPGVQVEHDGAISVNGKNVTKINVDGKPFFANDLRIASRNLEAALIDKVQVYDDRENDPDHLIPESKLTKIINLKLKRSIKKSTFGKAQLGVGTRDRFDAGLLLNLFRDTLQLSFIGVANNLNRSGFSYNDLSSMGGFNRSGLDPFYSRSITVGGSAIGAQEKLFSGGLNINNDIGKKVKLNLLIFSNRTSVFYNSNSFIQRFVGDTTLFTRGFLNNRQTYNKHSFSTSFEFKPNNAITFKYNPKFSYYTDDLQNNSENTSFSNFAALLNHNVNQVSGNNSKKEFQHNLSYYRRFSKPENSLNITHQLNINPVTGATVNRNDIISSDPSLPSDTSRRLVNNDNSAIDANLNVTLRGRLGKGIVGDISLNNTYNTAKAANFAYNFDESTGRYNLLIADQSNDLRRRQITETLQPGITWKLPKVQQLRIGLDLQAIQIHNRFTNAADNFDVNSYYFLPNISYNSAKISISYTASVTQPILSYLQPQRTVYNQLRSFVGNPGLSPIKTHYLNFYYNSYESKTQISKSLNGGVQFEENSIIVKRTVSPQGIEVTQPRNIRGNYSTFITTSYGKAFKKTEHFDFRMKSTLSASFSHSMIDVNGIVGSQNNFKSTFRQNFTLRWRDKLEFNPEYTLVPTLITYRNASYNALSFATHALNMPLDLDVIKKTHIQLEYNYFYNPLVSNEFSKSASIVNLSIALRFQKSEKGELRLSCYDMLNQNNYASRIVTDNTINDTQYQVLRRYFMLSYSYKFNHIIHK